MPTVSSGEKGKEGVPPNASLEYEIHLLKAPWGEAFRVSPWSKWSFCLADPFWGCSSEKSMNFRDLYFGVLGGLLRFIDQYNMSCLSSEYTSFNIRLVVTLMLVDRLT